MANTLQEIISQILIPQVPAQRQPPSRSSTAPYAPITAPPRHHLPYWIVHSADLAESMMQRLRAYLPTAPGGNMPPSPQLTHCIDNLPEDLLDTPAGELSSEETTAQLWDILLLPLIRYAVKDVDQNPAKPAIKSPDASPRLHREDKSWTVFDTFTPGILALAQHVEDGHPGTSLELRLNEEGARSTIIMKMGVSMIGGSNLIPYGILFGGHKFMLFSLFRNAHTLGQVRYGLACSDIINCTDIATPLIPLIIFTLLGNTNDLQLYQPTFTIPPIPSPVIQDSNPVTQSRLCQQSLYKKGKAIFHTHTPGGTISRSFLLYHEPTSHAVEDPFAYNASLVLFDQIEILLTECIGHGASGQVFLGAVDNLNEKYAIKIAPWKIGKKMLQREARIYEILSDLQGLCIPKIYGFFGSEHLKALVMDYMGCSVEKISDLSMDQRHQLLEELCLIHKCGVQHGDLRTSNIVLQNESAHFIDFSHGYEHQCTGRATCLELIKARQFLLLNVEHGSIERECQVLRLGQIFSSFLSDTNSPH